MKRFKVNYGKAPKTDRCGHFLPKDQQPPIYEEHFETLDEAMKFASKVHTKRINVEIYDCDGPKEDDEDFDSCLWLVGAWDRNNYYPNDNYANFSL